VSRAHGIAVLSGGAEYRPITIAPEAAQFLQSRNFTAAQIAALFKMPPELVGASLMGSGSITYANITDRWNELIRRWLPWIKQLQDVVTALLSASGESGLVAEVDTDVYARADIATRYGAYATGIGAGFLTAEDVRREEDLPPLPASEDGQRELSLDEFALAVQKMYLGVGVVITPEEARRRLGLHEPFVQAESAGQQSSPEGL
jgi:HK97 family phage portal protein